MDSIHLNSTDIRFFVSFVCSVYWRLFRLMMSVQLFVSSVCSVYWRLLQLMMSSSKVWIQTTVRSVYVTFVPFDDVCSIVLFPRNVLFSDEWIGFDDVCAIVLLPSLVKFNDVGYVWWLCIQLFCNKSVLFMFIDVCSVLMMSVQLDMFPPFVQFQLTFIPFAWCMFNCSVSSVCSVYCNVCSVSWFQLGNCISVSIVCSVYWSMFRLIISVQLILFPPFIHVYVTFVKFEQICSIVNVFLRLKTV